MPNVNACVSPIASTDLRVEVRSALWDPIEPAMWNRRRALRMLAAAGACAALRPATAAAQPRAILTRPIPSTGEALPVVGLGSWITFNVGDDTVARDACTDVMRKFVESGGRMIDSSPMYASSQDVIGYGLRKAALTGASSPRTRSGPRPAHRGASRSSDRAGNGRWADSISCRSTTCSIGRSICRRCSR